MADTNPATRYRLPRGMRYSALGERREFYGKEFDIDRVRKWLGKRDDKPDFAVIIGRHTGIFPEKYGEDAKTTIIIDEYSDLSEVRSQIIEFLPEGVYYDRNVYDENKRPVGQELAFDLDPENVKCPVHGTLADKMRINQGLSFCKIELGIVRQQAIELCEYLQDSFSDLRIVYSGRGFHIHVFDKNACRLAKPERKRLADNVKTKGFDIDRWITAGEMRLIRLPFTLHGLVSRVVLPLNKNELENFDAVTDARARPKFLRV